MIRRPPGSTRTAPPFPDTTLFRSGRRRERSVRDRACLGRVDRKAEGEPHPRVVEGLVGDVHAGDRGVRRVDLVVGRSEEHTSELQSLMRISYAVFCLKKKNMLSHIYTPP